jgi:hypothetical protein
MRVFSSMRDNFGVGRSVRMGCAHGACGGLRGKCAIDDSIPDRLEVVFVNENVTSNYYS